MDLYFLRLLYNIFLTQPAQWSSKCKSCYIFPSLILSNGFPFQILTGFISHQSPLPWSRQSWSISGYLHLYISLPWMLFHRIFIWPGSSFHSCLSSNAMSIAVCLNKVAKVYQNHLGDFNLNTFLLLWSLLEMQNWRPHPTPTESEYVF